LERSDKTKEIKGEADDSPSPLRQERNDFFRQAELQRFGAKRQK
jgi:hypothetical protein